jgi:hypothetical protein
MKQRTVYLALVAAFGLSACLGGGGGSSGPVTGALLDAAVSGVSYTAAPSNMSGTTNASGQFQCQSGDQVTFKVGDISLGTVSCAATVTPIELAGKTAWDASDEKIANRLLFLQMLDEDDDPSNGIFITGTLSTALKGKSIDFTKGAAAFDTDFAATLPTATDKFDATYRDRFNAKDATARRELAREHFEGTLGTALGQANTTAVNVTSAGGTVSITKYQLAAANSLLVPYEGEVAGIKKDFPNGFFPAAGSGLAFKGTASDGSLEFYGITDRGPNGDSPKSVSNPTGTASKIFPAPGFTPSIGTIVIGKSGAEIKSLLPIKVDASTKISGRPIPVGSVGNSSEIPLTDTLRFDAAKAGYDANGLDPESLVYDATNKVFWTSDEYGPFVVKVDATTGVIQKKYAPGTTAGSLPEVLKHRRANRGMEGLTMSSGKLHGFLQSPIDPLDSSGKSVEVTDSADMDQDGKNTDKVKVRDFAKFARWMEFDPATETAKLYAYPLDYAVSAEKWDKNRTGSAKLGDVVALSNGKFLVIEQGADSAGKVRNFLMLVEIPSTATDISVDGIGLEKNSIDGTTTADTTRAWSTVVALKKTLLLDLNALGWKAEKAEGLALVDSRTVALINDNDFGLRSIFIDAAGKEVAGNVEDDCSLDAATGMLSGASCPAGAVGIRVTRGADSERPTRLWLIKLPKTLTEYAFPN